MKRFVVLIIYRGGAPFADWTGFRTLGDAYDPVRYHEAVNSIEIQFA
jgi:hypothetical protein